MTIKVTIPTVEVQTKPRIAVFGVGGAGGNAVNNMIRANLGGVEFIAANTDAQALTGSLATQRIQIGAVLTSGQGAGSRPDVGRAAAEEQLDEILNHLAGVNMCFITAGMGGGTGTGAAPVIARAAREQGILTVGVVTKPFNFEGAHRMRSAEAGIQELAQYVDTLIIIPNQNLFRIANEKTTFADAFKMADDVLHAGVRGITDLIVMPGLINLDFADIRTVMTEMGKAMMGTGEASGSERAKAAAEAAISNPLLDDISMRGARGVLINITGGMDMTLFEVDEAANRIRDEVDPDANIIFGSTFDEKLEGKMRVSVVATGIETAASQMPRPVQPTLTVVHTGTQMKPAATATGGIAAGLRPAMGATATALKTSPFAGLTPSPMASTAPVAGSAALATALAEPVAMTVEEMVAEKVSEMAEDAVATTAAQSEVTMEAVVAPTAPTAPQVSPGMTSALRGESRGGAFITPRPAESGARTATVAPSRYEPPAAEPKKRGLFGGLFSRMTGSGAPEAPVAPAPAPRMAPQAAAPRTMGTMAPTPTAAQPPLEATTRAKATTTEDDMMEIPAFLRRQAN